MSKRNSREAKAIRRVENASRKVETYETERVRPEHYVKVWMTDDSKDQCIGLEIGGITHYIHSVTGAYLINAMRKTLTEWDNAARNEGAAGMLRKGESQDEYYEKQKAWFASKGGVLKVDRSFIIPDEWRFEPEE